MRLVNSENLSEHSLECAMLAHGLAVIGNTYFGKSYDADHIALAAMYHDAAEIITGDMPTPVKYYDEHTREAYKSVDFWIICLPNCARRTKKRCAVPTKSTRSLRRRISSAHISSAFRNSNSATGNSNSLRNLLTPQ